MVCRPVRIHPIIAVFFSVFSPPSYLPEPPFFSMTCSLFYIMTLAMPFVHSASLCLQHFLEIFVPCPLWTFYTQTKGNCGLLAGHFWSATRVRSILTLVSLGLYKELGSNVVPRVLQSPHPSLWRILTPPLEHARPSVEANLGMSSRIKPYNNFNWVNIRS